MKKMKIHTEKWIKQENVETEVNIPEEQMFLFITGRREAFSIKPVTTHVEGYTQLIIVCVDPEMDTIKRTVVDIHVSCVERQLNDVKTWWWEPLDYILNHDEDWYKEERRTREQFMKDYVKVLDNLNKSI